MFSRILVFFLAVASINAAEEVCAYPGVDPTVISLGNVWSVNVVNFTNWPTPLVPGEWVTIRGLHFTFRDDHGGNTYSLDGVLPLPMELVGTQVLVNGSPAAMRYIGLDENVFPNQDRVDVQLPYDLAVGANANIQFRLTKPDGSKCLTESSPVFQTANAFPWVISSQSVTFFDQTGAAITSDNPATAGQYLTMYSTGLGAVSPNATVGHLETKLTQTQQRVLILLDGVPAEVSYAGLAPWYTGIYQVNWKVPDWAKKAATYMVFVLVDGHFAENKNFILPIFTLPVK